MDTFRLLDYGFTVFFSVTIIIIILKLVKYTPELILVWRDFTNAIEKNTEITQSYYEKSLSFLDELKELKRKLVEHDNNAQEVRDNQEEILKILKEMEDALRKKKIIDWKEWYLWLMK